MKKVFVLGAGRVVRPFVTYLLNQPEFHVNVADRVFSRAESLISNHPRGEAQALDVEDSKTLTESISKPDIGLVASFLPSIYNAKIAELCIKAGKPMISTNYADAKVMALNEAAEDAGVLLLYEIGLDPGIDHMSAMKVIDRIHNEGGKIVSFRSVCGAIPAPEASLNPFGYKFSWFPSGALGAAKRPARYLQNGQEVNIPSDKLLEHYSLKHIEGLGYFENYPNKDCLPYIRTYGIPETVSIYRGTLRYIGWCETLKKFNQLGLLDEEERSDLERFSYRGLLGELIGSPANDRLEENLASYLHVDKDSTVMKRLEWLGFLSDASLSLKKGSVFDVLLKRMMEELEYEGNERDMIILQDEFIVEYRGRRSNERVTSTLIDYGIPGGDSAIARTVGLPSAIAAKQILDGKIDLAGIHIPVHSVIYKPVLKELEQQGITLSEKNEVLESKR